MVPMRHALPMSAREDAERPSLEEWLGELAASNDVRIPSVVCRDSAHGRGLFASTRVARGDVILSVPRRLTLCVQDGAGLSLPPGGTWPRVRAGVAANAPDAGKTWEYVLARAIVDAVAGDGGDFWAAYGGLMPPPASLAHPFLLPDALLAELQDPELEEDARIERARLQTLMPDLMDPLEPGGPPVGAWALALVRSRAMLAGKVRGGGDAHAIVPFLDLANHATAPTIDYRCDGVETPASSGLEPQATENLDRFELVALGDAESGEELRLAYTKGTLTSREHFAQYGFAPEGGSPVDRVDLGPIGGSGEDGPSAIEGKTATRLREELRAKLKVELAAATHRGEENGRAGWVAAGGFLSGLFASEGEPMTEEEEEMTLRAIRARVGELESSFRTSLEEDKAAATATAERLAKSPTPEDERMGNILGLRVIKKRLARRVAEILDSLGGMRSA